jgi:tousled-like kinase
VTQVQKSIIHENILRHYEVVEISDEEFATVLQLCEGPDLSTYLKVKKTLPEKEAKNITRQILTALKCLNENKIIHYDLKPGNILFDRGFVKVADFGLCKQMEDGMKEIDLTSYGVGTYWYLPPETFNYETDQNILISTKVDIWSVGVILFEMLYGQKPFGHGLTQNDIMRRKIMLNAKKVEFPPKPTVSKEMKEFIERCLCYNKEDRIDINEAYEMFCK